MTVAPAVSDRASGLAWRTASKTSAGPPNSNRATTGTMIRAMSMSRPWATSVKVAPRKPPKNV